MKTISTERFNDLKLKGRATRKTKRTPSGNNKLTASDELTVKSAAAMASIATSVRMSAELMDSIRQKLESVENRPASSYRFTVKRDNQGFITTVDAVPIK